MKEREPPQNRYILRNQTIVQRGGGARDRRAHRLRRFEAVRENTGETMVYLTARHGLSASPVAAIYKDRWQAVLSCKAHKQGLKGKTFVVSSPTAVMTRIWAALLAMLRLRHLQLSSRFGSTLSNLVALQRMNLFPQRDLMTWLDAPFPTHPDPQPATAPGALNFA